ncbi:MAG: GerMN domain-containing protein [Treponema sp.]|nr:GerMN domain-containing protein [Treponema sp.]
MPFKQIRRLAYLAAITVLAFVEMGRSGLSRRTFEFFTFNSHRPVVEDRLVHKTTSLEEDIKAYVEELILGPVSVGFAPLLTRGTKLHSFMFRNGTVYANFSRDAVIPVPGGVSLLEGFSALNRGIRRNFGAVSEVKLFAGGNEVFFGEF